jgi:hypothetical protein
MNKKWFEIPILSILIPIALCLGSLSTAAGGNDVRTLEFPNQVKQKRVTLERARAFKVPRELQFKGPTEVSINQGVLHISGRLVNPTKRAIAVVVFPVSNAYPLFMEFAPQSPVKAKPHPGPPLPSVPPPPLEFSIPPQTEILFHHQLELDDYLYQGSPTVDIHWQFHFWNDPRPGGRLHVQLPQRGN